MDMDIVFWNIGVSDPVTPADPIPTMPNIPKGALLVIGGRAPIWRFGLAFHAAHGSAAGAIASFDPRLGAVVVATHTPAIAGGAIINVDWPF